MCENTRTLFTNLDKMQAGETQGRKGEGEIGGSKIYETN